MVKSRILMIVGDYVEDYEVMVPFQALQMVGHVVHVICPSRDTDEIVVTAIHDFGNEGRFSAGYFWHIQPFPYFFTLARSEGVKTFLRKRMTEGVTSINSSSARKSKPCSSE